MSEEGQLRCITVCGAIMQSMSQASRSLYFFPACILGACRSFLRKFEFDYLIVDEGHTLKVRRYREEPNAPSSWRVLMLHFLESQRTPIPKLE